MWQPDEPTSAPTSLNKSRLIAQDRSQHTYKVEEDDDTDCVTTTSGSSYTFYIGDIDKLSKFFRRRFEELTMKPLRPIVTAWIKALEPSRLGSYGPYHKTLPKDQKPECTPAWWPADVRYEEPSHLNKTSKWHLNLSWSSAKIVLVGLLKVAVELMLQHRTIDESKRRKGSWVAKLQQAALYAVETTAPDKFSSSKGPAFSEAMRHRALKEILPSLFDIAQSHEDHLAQYDLYEGSGNSDPGNGRSCTWQLASMPPRKILARKRSGKRRVASSLKHVMNDERSGDETEVDDTISNAFLRKEQGRARKRLRTSITTTAHTDDQFGPEAYNATTGTPTSTSSSSQTSFQSTTSSHATGLETAHLAMTAEKSAPREDVHVGEQVLHRSSLRQDSPTTAPLPAHKEIRTASPKQAPATLESSGESCTTTPSTALYHSRSHACAQQQMQERIDHGNGTWTSATADPSRNPFASSNFRGNEAQTSEDLSLDSKPQHLPGLEADHVEVTPKQKVEPPFSHASVLSARLDDMSSRDSTSNPTVNTSFNQTMDSLHFSEPMDVDAKFDHSALYNDPSLTNDLFAPSRPMQYSCHFADYKAPSFHDQDSKGYFGFSTHPAFHAVPTSNLDLYMYDTPFLSQGTDCGLSTDMMSGPGRLPYPFDRLTTAGNNTSFAGLPPAFDGHGQESPRRSDAFT